MLFLHLNNVQKIKQNKEGIFFSKVKITFIKTACRWIKLIKMLKGKAEDKKKMFCMINGILFCFYRFEWVLNFLYFEKALIFRILSIAYFKELFYNNLKKAEEKDFYMKIATN